MSLRIITLAPVYALLSWLMMVAVPVARFVEVARDVYESYSLYCFWYLLVLWCGGQKDVTSLLSAQDGLCHLCPLFVPFRLGLPLRKFRGATGHFSYWRWAVLQHMFFKPLVTLSIALLRLSGQQWKFEKLRLIALLSTAVAMHAVLDTYMRLFDQLKGFNSEKKFLGIKLVVWITTGQQIFLSSLVSSGALPDGSRNAPGGAEYRAQRLVSFVVIVEMALFGLMLSYLFSRQGLTGKKPAKAEATGEAPATADLPTAYPPQRTGASLRERLDGGAKAEGRGALTIALQDPLASLEDAPESPGPSDRTLSLREVLSCWDVVLVRRVEDPSQGQGGAPYPLERITTHAATSLGGDRTTIKAAVARTTTVQHGASADGASIRLIAPSSLQPADRGVGAGGAARFPAMERGHGGTQGEAQGKLA